MAAKDYGVRPEKVDDMLRLVALASVADQNSSSQEQDYITWLFKCMFDSPEPHTMDVINQVISSRPQYHDENYLRTILDQLTGTEKYYTFALCSQVGETDGFTNTEKDFVHLLSNITGIPPLIPM